MKNIYSAQKDRFGRTTVFTDDHAVYFPADKAVGRDAAELKTIVATLAELDGTRESSDRFAHAVTTQMGGVFDSLMIDLVGMGRVARAHEDERPELTGKFHAPTTHSHDKILSAARSALKILSEEPELVPLFVDYGMEDDFVADLQADIAAAETFNTKQDSHEGERHEDVLGIVALIARGVIILKKLDAYAKNRFANDAVLLGAWKTASHLEIRRVHPQAAQPVTPTA